MMDAPNLEGTQRRVLRTAHRFSTPLVSILARRWAALS